MHDNFSEIHAKLQPVVQWLSDQTLDGIYSSTYWNDIEEEKKKEWWIADGNYVRCIDYLKRVGLLNEWSIVEQYISELPNKNRLQVADLAAGIGWASVLFSKLDKVAEVHATEISKHRLTELFPHTVNMLGGFPEKIRRYIGSFYELHFKDESMDVVFLSQAFHHADQPLKLLSEIDRITRKGGVVILSGENYITTTALIRRMLTTLLKQGRFCVNFYELFPADDASGDHYYRLADYYMFFRLLGYHLHHKKVGKCSLIFVAQKL